MRIDSLCACLTLPVLPSLLRSCSMGDWIMSWAWCLPCGFQSPLPYFYVIYFGILLFHRQTRDDEACALKCVPSLLFPLGRARAQPRVRPA